MSSKSLAEIQNNIYNSAMSSKRPRSLRAISGAQPARGRAKNISTRLRSQAIEIPHFGQENPRESKHNGRRVQGGILWIARKSKRTVARLSASATISSRAQRCIDQLGRGPALEQRGGARLPEPVRRPEEEAGDLDDDQRERSAEQHVREEVAAEGDAQQARAGAEGEGGDRRRSAPRAAAVGSPARPSRSRSPLRRRRTSSSSCRRRRRRTTAGRRSARRTPGSGSAAADANGPSGRD